MSKSILVIDTPKSCDKCPLFFNAYTDMICNGNCRTIDYPFPNNRIQEWCPLNNMPKKKEYDNALSVEKQWCFEAIVGYNACIEEILGENK